MQKSYCYKIFTSRNIVKQLIKALMFPFIYNFCGYISCIWKFEISVKPFFACIVFFVCITKPNLSTKNYILKSNCKILSLLMHVICYTHFIFIILSHFLCHQNLSTEINTPSLNCYCFFRVVSV